MLEKSGWGQGFRGMGQRAQESWEPPPPPPPLCLYFLVLY